MNGVVLLPSDVKMICCMYSGMPYTVGRRRRRGDCYPDITTLHCAGIEFFNNNFSSIKMAWKFISTLECYIHIVYWHNMWFTNVILIGDGFGNQF